MKNIITERLFRGMSTLARFRLSVLLGLLIVLGGTSQAIWSVKLPLYLIALAAIIHAFWTPPNKAMQRSIRPLLFWIGGFLSLTVLYLIPLPPAIWSRLSGRDIIVRGFELLGQSGSEATLPWMPLSVNPNTTLDVLIACLPVLAIAAIMIRRADASEIRMARQTVLIIACFSAVLGLAQTAFQARGLYFYEVTNFGYPVGLFSNVNHQACFLAMSIPLAWQELRKRMTGGSYFGLPDSGSAIFILALFSLVLFTTGIVLTGSVAGIILLAIAIIGCAALSRNKRSGWMAAIPAGLIIVVILLDGLLFGGIIPDLINSFSADAAGSRIGITKTTHVARDAFGMFGSGPGTFEETFRIFERREGLDNRYINHAHNDYLEFWLEYGVIGVVLLITGLLGFLVKGVRVFLSGSLQSRRSAIRAPLMAGLVAALPLIQSLVDYPLRTPAIAALFTFWLLLYWEPSLNKT